MIEKVNPSHPDKVADRIAGAIVDLAYEARREPKIAVEVLIGHRKCYISIETDTKLNIDRIDSVVERIAGEQEIHLDIVPQDAILAENQAQEMRCGDNGIFRGVPLTKEQKDLSAIARAIYQMYPSDGKYILDGDKLIVCQSGECTESLYRYLGAAYPNLSINPLGEWEGGPLVDSGATNRKIGSDMADSATGGGLHGKDLSKADVSINIYAFMKAQQTKKKIELSCAIGDTIVDGRPYAQIVAIARGFVKEIGGFEKLAEWGLF